MSAVTRTLLFMLLASLPLAATSTLVPAGHTGGYGEPTCIECHSGSLNPPGGSVSVSFPPVYTPGVAQTLQVSIADPGAAAWGFQLSARFTNGSQAGSFATSSVVAVRTANWLGFPVQYASQASAASQSGTQFQFSVVWTAPPDAAGGPVVFSVTGVAASDDRNSGDRTYGAEARSASSPPAANTNGVVDAACYQSPVSEGQLVSIFGHDLTPGGDYLAPGFPLPTMLSTVQVIVAGVQIPIVYAGPQQINAQLPFGLSSGTVPLYVKVNNVPGPPVSVTMASLAPQVFTLSTNGKGPGAILHPDYSTVTGDHPAAPGETVLIFATGLGQVVPQILAGQPGPKLSKTAAVVTVRIGGKDAPVVYSGLAPGFAGLYQINAVIPSPLSGIVEVLVTAGAVTSCSGVTVQIQ